MFGNSKPGMIQLKPGVFLDPHQYGSILSALFAAGKDADKKNGHKPVRIVIYPPGVRNHRAFWEPKTRTLGIEVAPGEDVNDFVRHALHEVFHRRETAPDRVGKNRTAHRIANILEDRRIELLAGKVFPGMVHQLQGHASNQASILLRKISQGKASPVDAIFYLAMQYFANGITSGHYALPFRTKESLKPSFDEWFGPKAEEAYEEFANAARNSMVSGHTHKVIDTAEAIYDKWIAPYMEENQPPPQKGKGEQQEGSSSGESQDNQGSQSGNQKNGKDEGKDSKPSANSKSDSKNDESGDQKNSRGKDSTGSKDESDLSEEETSGSNGKGSDNDENDTPAGSEKESDPSDKDSSGENNEESDEDGNNSSSNSENESEPPDESSSSDNSEEPEEDGNDSSSSSDDKSEPSEEEPSGNSSEGSDEEEEDPSHPTSDFHEDMTEEELEDIADQIRKAIDNSLDELDAQREGDIADYREDNAITPGEFKDIVPANPHEFLRDPIQLGFHGWERLVDKKRRLYSIEGINMAPLAAMASTSLVESKTMTSAGGRLDTRAAAQAFSAGNYGAEIFKTDDSIDSQVFKLMIVQDTSGSMIGEPTTAAVQLAHALLSSESMQDRVRVRYVMTNASCRKALMVKDYEDFYDERMMQIMRGLTLDSNAFEGLKTCRPMLEDVFPDLMLFLTDCQVTKDDVDFVHDIRRRVSCRAAYTGEHNVRARESMLHTFGKDNFVVDDNVSLLAYRLTSLLLSYAG